MAFTNDKKREQQIIAPEVPYDPGLAQQYAQTTAGPTSEALYNIRGAMPAITKANKKIVFIILSITLLIIAIAFLQVITPKQKKEQEAKPTELEQKRTVKQTADQLPDTVFKMKGNYKDPNAPALPTSAALPEGTPVLGPPAPGGIVPSTAGITPADAQAAGFKPVQSPLNGGGSKFMPGYEYPQVSIEEQQKKADIERKKREIEAAHGSAILVKMGGGSGGSVMPASMPSMSDGTGILSKLMDQVNKQDPQSQPTPDQNNQGAKKSFMKEPQENSPYVRGALQSPLSPYEIKAGTVIPIAMITGINSDLPGEVVAQVRENVYDTATGKYLLIPQGTRVKGTYDSQITYAQDGVLVIWQRLIFPNSYSINLENMPGADLSGYGGYRDQVNNHWGRVVGSAVLSTVFGIGAEYAAGQPTGVESAQTNLSLRQAAGQGAGEQIQNVGQQMTAKSMNIQPTIEIRMGQRYNIFVHKDLILRPYQQLN